MASITRETVLDASPEAIWDVLADYGAIHQRFAPGYVTDTKLEPGARLVTFADGLTVRERIIGLDPERRRIAYAVEGRFEHHNGAFEARAEAGGRTRLVWTADVLPDEAAPMLAERMDAGMAVIERPLGRVAA